MPHPETHTIIGIHVTDRVQHVQDVQQILTQYGRFISTRLGLHDTSVDYSSPNGLILVEFVGADSECVTMLGKLEGIEGIDVQKMVFLHS
ncbi:hypothetical protein HQ520_17580 [bacterium]|nr:hypothetical protein [bacterium]